MEITLHSGRAPFTSSECVKELISSKKASTVSNTRLSRIASAVLAERPRANALTALAASRPWATYQSRAIYEMQVGADELTLTLLFTYTDEPAASVTFNCSVNELPFTAEFV